MLPEPSPLSRRMALFAMVRPAEKLIALVPPDCSAAAVTASRPALAGWVTVTLTDSDLAVAGMPQAPVSGNVRSCPGCRMGPPVGPAGPRGAARREGGTG